MIVFKRTKCACEACTACCRSQPGHLLPGEMEKIAAHLQQPLAEVMPLFWASPGALVLNSRTGRQMRIGTITPRFDKRIKRCVFLTDENQCRIHEVSPFGCSYFDTHMTAAEGQRRSSAGLSLILDSPDYKALRAKLPFSDSYNPRGY